MKKVVTALDVAKVAGVSQSTVSRVFTPGANVSAKSRIRVMQVAKELGYQPNAIARSLITRKSNMIGLVMVDVKNPFYPEILDQFSRGLRERGYNVLFENIDTDNIRGDDLLPFFEYNVEGVIVTDASLSSTVVSRFQQNDIPVVLFNRYVENSPCPIVCCDNFLGGQKIGEYFLEHGHKRLAFISGRENTSTSRDRESGFRKALDTKGYKPLYEVGNYTYEGGYAATVRLLKSDNPPDGIFCANDIMALGALDAARQLGIKVPADVSIIGFDDIALASWPAYSLTTWQQPVGEMITTTIELLLGQIDGDGMEAEQKLIKGRLVERNTAIRRNEVVG